MALEHLFSVDKNTSVLIPTDGGRYDVNIPKRIKTPVYWKDDLNDEMEVIRASWFSKTGVNTWVPYDEALASRLESEYQDCVRSGQWKREIRIEASGGHTEAIRMISPNMIFHLPSESSMGGKLDEWGQVQPPNQDPSVMPREVHRGIEGIIEDIPDGEDMDSCDHLVFVIHGIGGACDIKFRPIHEVVDSYRDLTHKMSKKHFQKAHLMEEVNRVEFLPVNWHKTLHGEDHGTDERLKPLTLKSIPKLRNFVNDTLLDILFYTSPLFCQTILNTVVSEINRLYTLFCERNEEFNGKVSIMGHSLGSLITFDLLSHQTSEASASTTMQNVRILQILPFFTFSRKIRQMLKLLKVIFYIKSSFLQGIVLWLEKHTGPVAVEVTKPETVDEMKAKNDVVVLGCVEGVNEVAFAAVAEYYADDDIRFLMSNDAEVLKKNECKLGSVVMFKNFDEPKVEYSGEINKSVSVLQIRYLESYSMRIIFIIAHSALDFSKMFHIWKMKKSDL